MKIAHAVRRYSAAEWGGTETVVRHLVSEQRMAGHDARVFCTCALGATADGACAFPYIYPYFPMPAADRLALDRKGGNPYSPSLFKAIREWKPDVIHIHAGGRIAQSAVKLAEELGIPSVISLHGGAAAVPETELAAMMRPYRGKFPWGGIADRLLGLRFDPCTRASAVIAISREEERRLASVLPGRRVRYLPNGVDVPAAILPRSGRPLRNVLCVSRIDYQKNQLALVEALALVPSINLTLIGPITSEWYRDEIERKVDALHIRNRFRLIPGLDPDSPELKAEFASADIFAMASVHEPFGIVALEAWREGLPLVAPRIGGLVDFVKDGENGLLFDPSDSSAAAAAISRLIESPDLAVRLAEAGARSVREYSWDGIARKLEAIYDECR